jgi:hypothetical protein
MASTFCMAFNQMRLDTRLVSPVAAMIYFYALINAAQPGFNHFNGKNTLFYDN